MRTRATDYTHDTDRTYEIASGLAMPDAVATPQKPSTAEFARGRRAMWSFAASSAHSAVKCL